MGPVGTERSLMGTMRRILCLCLLQCLKSDPREFTYCITASILQETSQEVPTQRVPLGSAYFVLWLAQQHILFPGVIQRTVTSFTGFGKRARNRFLFSSCLVEVQGTVTPICYSCNRAS